MVVILKPIVLLVVGISGTSFWNILLPLPQMLDDTLPSPPAIFRPSPLPSQRYLRHGRHRHGDAGGCADGEEDEGSKLVRPWPWHPGT